MVNFHLVERMKINENTSVVDVALNLSGSLAGLPVVVEQLPVGEPVGFDAMPLPGEDVEDIGQTWTPDLQGKDVELDVPVYNPSAQQKEPYTTNMSEIAPVIADGEEWINALLSDKTQGKRMVRVTDLPNGFNLRGCNMVFTMTHLAPKPSSSNDRRISCRQFIESSYVGDILIHYGSSSTAVNRITHYIDYNYGTDSGPVSEVIYHETTGWQKKQIVFDPEVDNFIYANSLPNDPFDRGYWNWNYAYVLLPEFPNPKKKVCDIPVGFNLRGKTIYFRASELAFDLDRVVNPAYDWLHAVAESGKIYEMRAYRKKVNQRNGIAITATGDETVMIYDSFKGAFVDTKYTFPDTEDIIVTYNSLTIRNLDQWGWGFDYAEVSDDSTLPAPAVPDIIRPYFVYRNLVRCNLNSWVDWVIGQTAPVITGGGAVMFTTSGEANSYNGGGTFATLVDSAGGTILRNGDTVEISVQVRSNQTRPIRFGVGTNGSIPLATTGKVFNQSQRFESFTSTQNYNISDTSVNGFCIVKLYADTTPGTYEVQNIEVKIYKIPPHENISEENSISPEVYDWEDVR